MIVVVGLSHRSAPVEIRERLAVAPADVQAQLVELKRSTAASEIVLLSTCNRVEIVAAPHANDTPSELGMRIADTLTARIPETREHLYTRNDKAGIEHLFRVAGSLDSLVVGEPQILGQIKGAFATARAANTVGPKLNRVFEHAFRVAKRVRSETALGAGQVSIPTVAVDLAREIFNKLDGHKVVLIGAGEMGTLVADLLGRAGAQVLVVGRTLDRAREAAQRLGAEPHSWEDVPSLLAQCDIVVSSTSTSSFVVSREQLAHARRQRKGKNLFLVDLAVPRDIEPNVAGLDGVFLYNVDDLSKVADEALSSRHHEADKAAAIIYEETEAFVRRAHAERITPTLVALRERFREILDGELEHSLRGQRLPLEAAQKEILRRALSAAVEKVLHAPTERLRAWAKDELGDWHTDLLISAVEELFELSQHSQDATLGKETAKR